MSNNHSPNEDAAAQPDQPVSGDSLEAPSGGADTPTEFPIVAIGASAGGLKALEFFFAQTPPDSGMAFVVIQHLDPTRKSMLRELIQRHTQMKVYEVENGQLVERNCVYIIPPNREMTISQGRLYLAELTAPHGLNFDIFLRSLAKDQAERAICIVLSGAGTDGTLGLKIIKEAGGLVVAQEPESADYDGMPKSAISTGLVDYILPPGDMPSQLISYIQLAPFAAKPRPEVQLLDSSDALQQIYGLLRSQAGHDFSLYKKNTIKRRIERRMAVKHIREVEAYVQLLRQEPAEVLALFKELLIGVTGFFRDPEAYRALESKVAPLLFKDRRYDQPVRLWVPGCATGEEAYSLAIVLQERMLALKKEFKVQLFATDIDEAAIEYARQGIYPAGVASNISAERLQRFFVEGPDSYHMSEQIRKMVVYATQSLIKDPPFSRLDMISCRNLLIYLEPELQKKVLSLFYYALNPGGFLFLGTSETPVDLTPYFTPIDKKWKIFQRPLNGPDRRRALDFVTPTWVSPEMETIAPPSRPDSRAMIEKLLLERYVWPCMVINEQHEILYIYGRIGKYLEPVVGQTGRWNILRLVREELRLPVGAAIRQAITEKDAAVYDDAPLQHNGDMYTIRITVQPIKSLPSLSGLLVVMFQEKPVLAAGKELSPSEESSDWRDRRVLELEQELQNTKEYLQATIEELESSNEEIKSTNEELQSTNEELETSQEEAQSINEELVTLNAELQDKVEQLTWVNSDINNILASMDVGIIFLDRHMHIRRFNQAATQVVNLIETDVGRPIEHIVSKLAYNDWVGMARDVFRTLSPEEVEVQTEAGQWYLMRIRPYRTVENAIEGVVITFTGISIQKERLAAERLFAKRILDTMSAPLLVLGPDLEVVLANNAFYQNFKVLPDETRGRRIFELGSGQWDIPQLRRLLLEIIPQNSAVEQFEVEHDFPAIGRKKMRLNARQIVISSGQPPVILLAIEEMLTVEEPDESGTG